MNPKPPKSGRGRRILGLAAVGATVLGFVGAGLATAGPALADPAVSYLGVGSNASTPGRRHERLRRPAR